MTDAPNPLDAVLAAAAYPVSLERFRHLGGSEQTLIHLTEVLELLVERVLSARGHDRLLSDWQALDPTDRFRAAHVLSGEFERVADAPPCEIADHAVGFELLGAHPYVTDDDVARRLFDAYASISYQGGCADPVEAAGEFGLVCKYWEELAEVVAKASRSPKNARRAVDGAGGICLDDVLSDGQRAALRALSAVTGYGGCYDRGHQRVCSCEHGCDECHSKRGLALVRSLRREPVEPRGEKPRNR